MKKIVGIGESVLDIVFKNGKPLAAVPGGSTFNAMVSVGRTAGVRFPDVDIVMITQTGDDKVGDIVEDFMHANHMSTGCVIRKKSSQSTISLALLDEHNNASYEFFREKDDSLAGNVNIEFNAGDLVIFGSFFAINPSFCEFTQGLVRKAKEAGAIIYYDINFRKSHLAELEKVKGSIEQNCALSDFVRGSDEDIEYLYGSADAPKVYAEHISKLCPNFICTHGGDPAEVFSPGLHETYPVPLVKEVVSTIGAGDNFNAGFNYALLNESVTKGSAANMTPDLWSKLVHTATKFSSNVCGSIFNYVDEEFWKGL